MKSLCRVIPLVGVLVFAIPTAQANLLTNGSFETGDFSGWTPGGNFSFTNVFTVVYGPEDGAFYVHFGPAGSDGTLSQTFVDTPGGTLHVSGWLVGNGTNPSDWNMSIDGTTYVSVNPVPNQPYTQYTFGAPATGLDTFTVGFRNDPNFDGMDNFVITETAGVPEPATLTLLVGTIMGIGIARRCRKTR